jgi:CheY-like chemotaxis protein
VRFNPVERAELQLISSNFARITGTAQPEDDGSNRRAAVTQHRRNVQKETAQLTAFRHARTVRKGSPDHSQDVSGTRPVLTIRNSILVVDDTRDSREMLAEYLTFCGFDVHQAEDGLEAIDKAVRIHPPIILMDLMMPRLDGWEATRRLKADERTRDITIIALSAFSCTDERHLAHEAGCDDFIPKPCDLDHLAHVVRNCLDRPGASA